MHELEDRHARDCERAFFRVDGGEGLSGGGPFRLAGKHVKARACRRPATGAFAGAEAAKTKDRCPAKPTSTYFFNTSSQQRMPHYPVQETCMSYADAPFPTSAVRLVGPLTEWLSCSTCPSRAPYLSFFAFNL